jgi:hypothetical protein
MDKNKINKNQFNPTQNYIFTLIVKKKHLWLPSAHLNINKKKIKKKKNANKKVAGNYFAYNITTQNPLHPPPSTL